MIPKLALDEGVNVQPEAELAVVIGKKCKGASQGDALGYVFGYLTGGIDVNSLNVIYNLADFINKIAFGLVIWVAAVSSGGRVR